MSSLFNQVMTAPVDSLNPVSMAEYWPSSGSLTA